MNVQKIMMKTNKEWLRATKPLTFNFGDPCFIREMVKDLKGQ
jgi:hypothetical protein